MAGRKLGWRKNATHCSDCGTELNESNIVHNGIYKRSKCNVCHRAYSLKKYDFERDRSRNLQKKYGMSLEDYGKLFNSQLGKCAVCLQPSDKNLHVDHNHLTGEVRGLLCQRCNHVVGLLEENPDVVMRIYEYLSKTTWEVGLDKISL